MTYHHGRLKEAIVEAAVTAIAEEGVACLSLRSLAQRVGVSHTAPRHHFGDKEGVLSAVAAQGYSEMARAVREGTARGGLLEAGVAYVVFAHDHPGHFPVMFRPDLVNAEDTGMVTARDELYASLQEAISSVLPGLAGEQAEPVEGSFSWAAWSLAHGVATLAASGALTALAPGPLPETTRAILRHLDTPPGSRSAQG